jgi:hypothetical protein
LKEKKKRGRKKGRKTGREKEQGGREEEPRERQKAAGGLQRRQEEMEVKHDQLNTVSCPCFLFNLPLKMTVEGRDENPQGEREYENFNCQQKFPILQSRSCL